MGGPSFFAMQHWCYATLEQMDPVLLKILRRAQMPAFADGSPHTAGGYISTWAVLKNAHERDAGIELMKYWSRAESAEKWVRYTKSPTGLTGCLCDSRFGKDIYAEFQRRLVAEVGHSGHDPLMFCDRLEDEGKKME
jgi:hypothetical protein